MKRLCISIEVLPDYFDLNNKKSVAEYFGHKEDNTNYLNFMFLYKNKLHKIYSLNESDKNKKTDYTLYEGPSLEGGLELDNEADFVDSKHHKELTESYLCSIEKLKTDLNTTNKELSFFKEEYSKPKIDKDLVLELVSAVNGNKLK